MAKLMGLYDSESTKHKKKTRQGMSRGTKLGTKHSKKYYTKKYRGQGGKKR